MDNAKRAMILDSATDFYTLIRDVLALERGDVRAASLNRATEKFLNEVLELTSGGVRAVAEPAQPIECVERLVSYAR